MESPPRSPPTRRYPVRSNRTDSRPRRRRLVLSSSSSSSSTSKGLVARAPPPTSKGPVARASPPPPPSLPPTSSSASSRTPRRRTYLPAAVDSAKGKAVSPLAAKPQDVKSKRDKKKEVKETPEGAHNSTSRGAKDAQGPAGLNNSTYNNSNDAIDEVSSKCDEEKRQASSCMTVNIGELNYTLDTLGVVGSERACILDDLFNKWNDILNETIHRERGRCDDLMKKISVLTDKYIPLCQVLGEAEKVSEIQETASLRQLDSFLSSAVTGMEQTKRQRLIKLQELQLKMIDLWDRMGVTIMKQRPYSYMMRNCNAKLNEVVEMNALSPGLLKEVEHEVTKLELLLKEAIANKLTVLDKNLSKSHMLGDKDYEVQFILADVKEGKVNLLSADARLEELVQKSKIELVERGHIVARAAMILNAVKDGRTPKKQGTNDVTRLKEKVYAWEERRGRDFLYDGELLSELLNGLCSRTSRTTGAAAAAAAQTWSDSEKSASDRSSDPDFKPESDEEEVQSSP